MEEVRMSIYVDFKEEELNELTEKYKLKFEEIHRQYKEELLGLIKVKFVDSNTDEVKIEIEKKKNRYKEIEELLRDSRDKRNENKEEFYSNECSCSGECDHK